MNSTPGDRLWHLRPGIALRERTYAPGQHIGWHCHAHATVILVLDGGLTEHVDGTAVRRGPGEVHVLPGGVRHATSSARGASAFLIGLYDDWLDHSPERRGAVARTAIAPVGSSPAALVRRIRDEWHAPRPATELAAEGLLLEALAHLQRDPSAAHRDRAPGWLTRVRARLDRDFAEPPPVAGLATDAGVSPGHLHRAFRAHFGCTPGTWIRRVRIERAKEALRLSNAPIARIAAATGFGDQAHLTRTFRALVGATPGEYRRRCGARPVQVG